VFNGLIISSLGDHRPLNCIKLVSLQTIAKSQILSYPKIYQIIYNCDETLDEIRLDIPLLVPQWGHFRITAAGAH